MAESYLRKLARESTLLRSWLYLSDSTYGSSRESKGVDGQSVNQFATRTAEYIGDIRRSLLRPGGYKFSKLKPHLEPKNTDGYRAICVPTVKDRVVQRALLDLLATNKLYAYESQVSFGFIQGRTVKGAIEQAISHRKGHPWAYKTDITKFFDTISRKRIAAVIEEKVRVPTLQPLLIAATQCEVQPRNNSQKKKLRKAGIIKGKGLRQGMPLSPYLSNIFLWEFDQSMIDRSRLLVRYADDLIFLADSEEKCRSIHYECEHSLRALGLSIEPIGSNKTQIIPPTDAVEFLGISIEKAGNSYQPMVPARKLRNMRAELKKLSQLAHLDEEGITISALVKLVDGKISGWLSTYRYCANFEVLSSFLHDTRRQLLQDIFVKELGISLTNRVRRFLEID